MIVDGTPKRFATERAEARSHLIDELLRRIAGGARSIELCGEPTSFLAFVIAQLQHLTGRQVVVITDREEAARDLVEDLQFFCGPGNGLDPVVTLPQLDQNPYRQSAPARREMMSLLAGLTRLNQGLEARVVVTTALACARKTVPPSVLSAFADVVAKGEELDRPAFLRRLVDGGYQSVSLVEDPGTFAVRGGLIDVYSPLYPNPMRIDLFGDEVESIRFFETETQRTCGDIDEAYVGPVREVLLLDKTTAIERRLRELADRLELPSSTIRRLLDDLRHEIYFFGIESLLPAFHEQLQPMVAHIPADAIWITIDGDRFASTIDGFRDNLESEYADAVQEQQLCYAPDDLFSSGSQLDEQLQRETIQRISLKPFQIGDDTEALRLDAEQHLGLQREIENRSDREHVLQPFVDHVRAWIDEGLCVLLVAAYRSQAQRWSDLLESYPVDVQLVEDPLTPSALSIIRRDARPRAYMVIGRLNGGFVDHQSQLALIGYEELFGRKVHKPRRRSESPFSTDFQDLRPDDLVVHVDHGIGKYRGLMTLSVGGIDFDFMRIDYRGEDKLYVPVAQLNKVQKLTGTEKVPPLAKLGAATWAKTKGKVKAAVREMADDLLRLYAQRAASPGHAFTPPDSFFREFEAAFPFEETPDQERVIAEVLDDMARDQTMDRLVCGDVGFGKTEVAMRAAFKAVLDGKQVAVLCPTTVLAEQHLLSFRDRFHRYPVRIESLSRFKSKPEQKEVLKALAAGQIDVVISTHRLLSKDVVFRDLGLLVVDEEHRFGVAHKERLKQLKHQIDVLTLTATPIPRTLNMSLSGIRDLSIIATPPQDRLAVVTRVEPTNDRTIREAILFELRRGGQVYFVHNRVQDIEKVSDKLAELVPEARLVIAHGQLGEGELEKRMLSFMHGEANVLICTTIIESGIDIPRANTMFIHRADAFGLAQLYQLRGRVGRSKDRAFCYLLVPKPDALTNDARQRIGVMQRFSELGAGFQIATYDLEIRGAGELLGTSQSGQIAAVGFELYSQLLAEAVAELRGEAIDDIPDPEIKVAVEALIPESYVPDTNVRLILYKKLAASRNEEELQYAVDELIDRFGALPRSVDNLVDVVRVKQLARELRVRVVDLGSDSVRLTLSEASLERAPILDLMNAHPRLYRLTPEMVFEVKRSRNTALDGLGELKKTLRDLIQHANKQ